MNLITPRKRVEILQKALHEKAKAEPSYSFYSLWDKVFRKDVIEEAYRKCKVNKGASGIDNIDFNDIESEGLEVWLGKLQEELRSKTYLPMPLLRVWIPKANGKDGMRPLGIPTIRDRVVQMAAVIILSPIFEADLFPNQYGFRPGLDAKLAIRNIFFHMTKNDRTEIVDGDLKDYFNKIPHGALMKCLSRRIADKAILSLIKSWLEAPVIETSKGKKVQTTESKDSHRGTPQGGVCSPLLANIYFRRFCKAWEKWVTSKGINAHLVNYADDFVICCTPGIGKQMMELMRKFMELIGLTVNEAKTKLVSVKEENFDFLGYTFGKFYSKDGKSYLGTKPSKKAIKKLLKKIHDETSHRWSYNTNESRIETLNPILRGWCNYFDQGPVLNQYKIIKNYTEKRLRRLLAFKHKQRGTGYRQYPDEYLYGKLGLYKLPMRRADMPRAKS